MAKWDHSHNYLNRNHYLKTTPYLIPLLIAFHCEEKVQNNFTIV